MDFYSVSLLKQAWRSKSDSVPSSESVSNIYWIRATQFVEDYWRWKKKKKVNLSCPIATWRIFGTSMVPSYFFIENQKWLGWTTSPVSGLCVLLTPHWCERWSKDRIDEKVKSKEIYSVRSLIFMICCGFCENVLSCIFVMQQIWSMIFSLLVWWGKGVISVCFNL